ncbi:MAG: hypothetical protein HC813_01080 [Planctomycetes bacterium]|nr:hypothetical protein [Planctomycetota bacterium]
MRDARDGTLWACIGHGHWGPKLHVSSDDMKSFEERTCPAFPEGCEVDSVTDMGTEKGTAAVKILYTIVPAGPAGHYHIGTDPGAMFTTTDAGVTWKIQESLWNHRNKDGWFPGGGGVMLHAILVHPEDPQRMHIGISCAGVYETRDGGVTWEPRNRGVRADFLPNKSPVVGQDTHCLRRHRKSHDLLWQQNHCGNYRSTDAAGTGRK